MLGARVAVRHILERILKDSGFIPFYVHVSRMSELTEVPSETVKDKEVVMDGDRRQLDLEEWRDGWEIGETDFHLSEYNPKLVRFLDKLVDGRKDLKFFFPLCGKTMDMKWMYDLGHSVIGVEASPKACEEFFLDNDLTYLAEAVKEVDGSLYKSEDNRIKIYCCDLYKFSANVEKDISAVFDRGSLVAINKADRKRYVELITSILRPDCRYLLCTFDYDRTKYAGPPHFLSLEELTELYGSKFNMELLAVDDAFEERHRSWGLDALDERVHLFTLKQE